MAGYGAIGRIREDETEVRYIIHCIVVERCQYEVI